MGADLVYFIVFCSTNFHLSCIFFSRDIFGFGVNEMFSYEIGFSIYVILGAVGFLFISVLVPSFKAANMRAIDALRSG